MNLWHEWRSAPAAEFAVVGDPVSHSLSPRMQAAAFQAMGLSFEYLAIRVPKEEFDEAAGHLTRIGYRGLNVTVPLKEAAFGWARETDALTEKIGAANTLELATGRATNTDAPGLLDVFESLDILPSAKVLLLGAGGTARAIAAVLHLEGYAFAIYNRTPARAERFLADLGIQAENLSEIDVTRFDVLVNATSAELMGSTLQIDWQAARPGAAAIDMLYASEGTEFVREARQWGLRAVDGRTMLVAQGARSLEWWLGVSAPRSAMLKAIS